MSTQTDSILFRPQSRPVKSGTRLVLFVDEDWQLKTRRPDGTVTVLGVAGATAKQQVKTSTSSDGEDGAAATIVVGSVVTGDPGSSASVINVGTENAAVLNFSIPKGQKGDPGDSEPGPPGTIGPRSNVSVSSASIASNATWTGTFAGLGKTAIPHVISASRAAWIRVYKSLSYLTADAAREMDVDAVGEHGLVLEFILEGSDLTYDIGPQFPISNASGSADYPISVRNLSGSAGVVTVSVSRSIIET